MGFIARNLRRLVVFGSAALLAGTGVVAVATPAAAATPPTVSASAFWHLNGPFQSAVSVQAVRSPGAGESIFIQINQTFCDTHTNEMVFRTFSVSGAFRGRVVPAPNLAGAVLGAITRGDEIDQRLTDCANPTGQPRTVDLGPVTVAIAAEWTATGPFMVVQPGIVARTALAHAFVAGPNSLGIGNLGPSLTAELRRSTL